MFKVKKSRFHIVMAALGFMTCIPIFLLPGWPFVHVNFVDAWMSFPPYQKGVHTGVHPSYTFSLGLAAPLCVATTVCWRLAMSASERLTKIEFRLSLSIVFGLIGLHFLTGSIRALGLSASVIGLLCLALSNHDRLNKLFAKYAFAGLVLFAVLHAVYLFSLGIEQSKKIDAFVFFGFEIYQALVSYPAVLVFLLGSILLVPEMLTYTYNKRVVASFHPFLLVFVLACLIFVVLMLGRRISILVLAAAFGLLLLRFFSLRNAYHVALLIVSIFTAHLVIRAVYDGTQAFDYEHLVKPRLLIYLPTLYEILDGGFSSSLFFGHGTGYAEKHNMLLDTVYFSGLTGLAIVSGIFISLVYIAKSNGFFSGLLRSKRKKSCTALALIAIFFDNMGNQNITLPYYSISIFLIYSYAIFCVSESENSASRTNGRYTRD